MPAMEFSHWIAKVADHLGYTPEPGGIEEETIKNRFYGSNVSPMKAAWEHKISLLGPPAKDQRIRHF